MMEIPSPILIEGARRFNANPDHLHPLGGMDGAVYTFPMGERAGVLKYEPAGPDKAGRIAEKIEFIQYLWENGIRVPQLFPSIDGHLVEFVELEGQSFAVSCMEKAAGANVYGRNAYLWTEQFFRAWGEIMGHMHLLTRQYPRWRRADGEPPTEMMDWQQELQSFISTCQDKRALEKWHSLAGVLASFPIERDCFGLIHNDLHNFNMLVDRSGKITVIDFDVCAYHWFATDIGIAIFHALWQENLHGRTAPDRVVKQFLYPFMEGYYRCSSLDPVWITRLPTFLEYRNLLLFTAFSQSGSQRDGWLRWAVSDLRKRIHRGVPIANPEVFQA